ncbi:hypothetical protein [Methanolapillus millepedarum]|uniref:Uncharacterized protein n=1 Tax=Methanolapillus millepedarum TaxID=3028296 RepID=A0AA96ZWE1_9EURY|nr:hypothetical protein MsAc7_14160 [Methanosarcinaceae archaeon Ac7]
MQPRLFQDYLWFIFKGVLILIILASVLFSFLFKNASFFVSVYGLTQLLVSYYCLEHYQFFKIHSKTDAADKTLHTLFSFIGYLFNAFAFPLILIDLIASIYRYLNPELPALDIMGNYLFVYPFLFIFDLIFILFFRHLTKHATKAPSIKKSKAKVNSK